MAKYVSKHHKKYLWFQKLTRNHTARLKEVGRWHGLPRLTFSEWKERLEEFDNCCAYCWEKKEPEALWVEHIVGIKEGGEHRKHNVIPACQKCNQQKGTKSLEEWKGITAMEIFAKAAILKAERERVHNSR